MFPPASSSVGKVDLRGISMLRGASPADSTDVRSAFVCVGDTAKKEKALKSNLGG
jgi:hypothetical protein